MLHIDFWWIKRMVEVSKASNLHHLAAQQSKTMGTQTTFAARISLIWGVKYTAPAALPTPSKGVAAVARQ
jgi:hypothetical protein